MRSGTMRVQWVISLGALIVTAGLSAAQTPSPARLLVLLRDASALAIVDPVSRKELGRVPTVKDPHEVTVSADGTTAFVASPSEGIAVIDLAAQKELRRVNPGERSAPHDVLFADGKLYFTAEGFKTIDWKNYTDLIERLGDHDAEDVLPTIDIPTLIITGDRDLFTPVFTARKMNRKIVREAIWIVAVLAFLVATHADLTGRLLVWDARGYWTTVRAVELLFMLPGLGPLFAALIGGTDIDSLVLTRFYVLHAAVLPAVLLFLFYLHFSSVLPKRHINVVSLRGYELRE